jgi:hypothetical protein
MFIREARREGRKPPTKPMIKEKAMAFQPISAQGERKASSGKVWKFMVEMVEL